MSVTVRSGSVSVWISYLTASRKEKFSGEKSLRAALSVVSLMSWSKMS